MDLPTEQDPLDLPTEQASVDLPMTCAIHKEVCLTFDSADLETKKELNVCMKCLDFADESGHDLMTLTNDIPM